MALIRLDPPGFLDDLDDHQRNEWSANISDLLDAARENDGSADGLTNYGPRHQFFNPLRQPPGADAVEKDITWSAFPRLIETSSVSDKQRWQRADATRDVQDEYCEWNVERDANTNKIIRVTFTSEGPEYWEFLAAHNPSRVVELYQKHVNPQIKESDLFNSHGKYIRRNRWNNSTQMGAMHLVQTNNTLGAEIELAASATIVRLEDGQPLTTEAELIACGKYGQAGRNSDPHIGAEVNALARAKHDVTLANPVGLCIAGLNTIGWLTPDGSAASDYWKITRGTPQKALRAVYEVPKNKGFDVGDVKIKGKPIEFGAQVADFITIKLTGLATRLGQSTVKSVNGCVGTAHVAHVAARGAFDHVTSGSRR
jgi:hypothetical protein